MILHGKGKGTCGGDWRDLGRKTHHLITGRWEEYNVLHVSLYHEHKGDENRQIFRMKLTSSKKKIRVQTILSLQTCPSMKDSARQQIRLASKSFLTSNCSKVVMDISAWQSLIEQA